MIFKIDFVFILSEESERKRQRETCLQELLIPKCSQYPERGQSHAKNIGLFQDCMWAEGPKTLRYPLLLFQP